MSDQTRREAGEDFRIVGLLQPAFLQVIIVLRPTHRIFGGTGTGGSSRTAFKSIAGDCPRLLPMPNKSAPCAINSGRVPGNPPSRCVRPCQPEPSSAAMPGDPPVSKLMIRMSYLLFDFPTLSQVFEDRHFTKREISFGRSNYKDRCHTNVHGNFQFVIVSPTVLADRHRNTRRCRAFPPVRAAWQWCASAR